MTMMLLLLIMLIMLIIKLMAGTHLSYNRAVVLLSVAVSSNVTDASESNSIGCVNTVFVRPAFKIIIN